MNKANGISPQRIIKKPAIKFGIKLCPLMEFITSDNWEKVPLGICFSFLNAWYKKATTPIEIKE